MLKLEDGQLHRLERHMLEVLQRRLERVIAANFPEIGATSPDGARVASIVQRGVENALRYGIDEDADLAAFIALGLAWRSLPPESSVDWIRHWLERTDTPGSTKLAVIEAQLANADSNAALAALTKRVARARRDMQAL
jgi:hypothetical protein